MLRKSLLLSLLSILLLSCVAKKNWDYEPISFDTHTADPSKMDAQVRIKRMPRGEYSYDGYMNFGYEVNENTLVEAIAYRSQTGHKDDYTLMPWEIEQQPFPKFIENFYEEMVYSNFGSCTNLPKPGDTTPWPMINITFKECVCNGEGMPEMAPQGYYKVQFKATGDVEWGFESIVKIFDKYSP